MKEQKLTCITCPVGCQMTVNIDISGNISVFGNSCKRGEIYAKNEFTNPVRVVTSTIKTNDGTIVPVKTDKAIPKSKIMECMKEINLCHPDALNILTIGSIVCKNILGTDANIVTTAPIRR